MTEENEFSFSSKCPELKAMNSINTKFNDFNYCSFLNILTALSFYMQSEVYLIKTESLCRKNLTVSIFQFENKSLTQGALLKFLF